MTIAPNHVPYFILCIAFSISVFIRIKSDTADITHRLLKITYIHIGTNLAVKKTIALSRKFAAWPIGGAVDGQRRTDADLCACCTATEKQAFPWLQIDLGQPERIRYIVLYGRQDHLEYSDRNYNILTLSFLLCLSRPRSPRPHPLCVTGR